MCLTRCSRALLSVGLLAVLPAVQAAPAISHPLPDHLVWQGEPVAVYQHDGGQSLTADDIASEVDVLLERSERTGDPRFLGEASAKLALLQSHQWTPSRLLQRAVIEQRLHQFERASETLEQVLRRQPDHRQALLVAFVVALTRGDLGDAASYCTRYGMRSKDLAAATCDALMTAARGDEDVAGDALTEAIAARQHRGADPVYVWALAVLADIVAERQPVRANRLLALAHALDPDDLHVRQRYAQSLVATGDFRRVLVVTQGWAGVEGLAIPRIMALRQLDPEAAQQLDASLAQQFRYARQREDFLHAHEYAVYLLEVRKDAQRAYDWAQRNWQGQRQLADYRLLKAAAVASGNLDQLPRLTIWQPRG